MRSIDFLRALLESTPDAIYFKDRESRFLMVSRSLARLLGLADPQEAYGRCDHDFFSAEHADQARNDERHIIETGEPVIDLIEKETWPDGHVTWASSTKLPLRDPAGRTVGTFGISRDITARTVAEQRLQSAQQELRASNRRIAGLDLASTDLAEAFRQIESARLRGERVRRRAQRTEEGAVVQLATRLASQLPSGRPEQQLALDLCALTTSSSDDRTALLEDLGAMLRDLEQLTKLLGGPR